MAERAQRVGVVASDCHFPSSFVSQGALEAYDGVSAGKYTKGLGVERMAFCGPEEDINSMCLNALSNLMEKYGLDYNDIGRLEIGTETLIDKSKSTKTTMMPLFGENTNVLGVTNINACYGGTAALFNTIDWMESSAWDGRYGVVLMGDIAVYEPGPARTTGGAGVVALLIGPDAPIVFENRLRSSHFEEAYDFYKPDLTSEYPYVDGHVSNVCYLRALDKAYMGYKKMFKDVHGTSFDVNESAKALLFHQPYAKLVQKSYGRLFYNDFIENPETSEHKEVFGELPETTLEESYSCRNVDAACKAVSADGYNESVFPYTYAGRHLGNSYAGSLYFSLLSLIAQSDKRDMRGERAVMFSYGSGLAATMFSAVVDGDLEKQRTTCNLNARLDEMRTEATPEEFTTALLEREEFNKSGVFPEITRDLWPNAYYLNHVDSLKRRSYIQTSSAINTKYDPIIPRASMGGYRKFHGMAGARRVSQVLRRVKCVL